MGRRLPCEENKVMRCRACGALLESRVTDLPFKLADTTIVIVKALPVLQCPQCGDTELEQATMSRVEPTPGRRQQNRRTGSDPVRSLISRCQRRTQLQAGLKPRAG